MTAMSHHIHVNCLTKESIEENREVKIKKNIKKFPDYFLALC